MFGPHSGACVTHFRQKDRERVRQPDEEKEEEEAARDTADERGRVVPIPIIDRRKGRHEKLQDMVHLPLPGVELEEGPLPRPRPIPVKPLPTPLPQPVFQGQGIPAYVLAALALAAAAGRPRGFAGGGLHFPAIYGPQGRFVRPLLKSASPAFGGGGGGGG